MLRNTERAIAAIAKQKLQDLADQGAEVAYEMAPFDLGPLREAIHATPVTQSGDMLTCAIEYGDPVVDRPRGYYPGVLQEDPLYGHVEFVNKAAEAIARHIQGEI
jgi:hypothetical protein